MRKHGVNMKRLLAMGTLGLALTCVGTTATHSQMTPAHIYPEVTEAKPDIQNALATAKREHKRVILVFGGDWCGDCQVLNIYMHRPENQPIVDANYVVEHVNIGHMDQNIELAQQYGVPIKRGVPALAVLNPDGTPVFSQKNGDFASMRHMDPQSVTTFLNEWKPKK